MVMPSAFAVLRLATLELGRLLDQQIGRIGAFEYMVDIIGGSLPPIDRVGCVGRKQTIPDHCSRSAEAGQPLLQSEGHDHRAVLDKDRVTRNGEPPDFWAMSNLNEMLEARRLPLGCPPPIYLVRYW